jgi:hypothetical protein
MYPCRLQINSILKLAGELEGDSSTVKTKNALDGTPKSHLFGIKIYLKESLNM